MIDRAIESIVSPEWLLQQRSADSVRIVDVRWSLKASGRSAYEAGHLPGAVFLDLDADLSASSGPGRHPIPDQPQVERVFGQAGVDADTHVIAYDDASGSIAARVWFLLRLYGHDRVSILDGGYRAWVAAGGAVETAVQKPAPRSLILRAATPGTVVDKAYVRELLPRVKRGKALLLDARSGERYRGESEPIDARAGHIPGAKNAPWDHNVAPDPSGIGRLRSPAELRALYAGLGADQAEEVVVYCGSSVTACFDLLALERAGLTGGRVYEGSWSEWARDDSLPAARGNE